VVIAIDGPAGAGKSTVSRALAERLGATYLDSGAMYRSVALLTLRAQADPDDPARVVPLAQDLELGMEGTRITVGGEDVSLAIRTPEVSATSSRVSVHPGVREAMVARQRELLGSGGGWVAEGRDIGTVVWPQAELKVYLTASDEERARRRAAETGEDPADVLDSIRDRDARDTGREHGALTAADDSVEVDTTGLTLDQVVERIAALAHERGLA
jgi:cytidylate kinase